MRDDQVALGLCDCRVALRKGSLARRRCDGGEVAPPPIAEGTRALIGQLMWMFRAGVRKDRTEYRDCRVGQPASAPLYERHDTSILNEAIIRLEYTRRKT